VAAALYLCAAAGVCGGARAGISEPPPSSVAVRHAVPWPDLQALGGRRLRDPRAARLLTPSLRRVLGRRYDDFMAALGEEAPMRVAGAGLIGQAVVADTLGYRGAFFAYGRDGDVLAVLKGGPHGTTIERFGSLRLLGDPALLDAYREFVGIDE
jgi:hypothetical protein